MHKFSIYFAVGIGGAIGSVFRFLLSFMTYGFVISLPIATFIVNITGAFLLTYITFHPKIKSKLSNENFTALTVGLIGSYTTFSTIIIEIVELTTVSLFYALTYLFSTIIVGFLASYLGYYYHKYHSLRSDK